MAKIKIILGSSRPNRFGMQPATWLMEVSKKIKGAEFELIDLAELNLPFFNEPVSPKFTQDYQHDHTKQWSKIVGEADGFVFVAAEYNHGYTPVMKNALDFLYYEWLHKPAAFLSYGADAGGARSVEQLRQVVGQLDMYDISEHVIMPEYYTKQDENGNYQFTEAHEANAIDMLTRVVFWADVMKAARPNLPALVAGH